MHTPIKNHQSDIIHGLTERFSSQSGTSANGIYDVQAGSQRGFGIPSYVVAKANGVTPLRQKPLYERRFSFRKFDASARRQLQCRLYARADLDSAVLLLALIPLLQSCPSKGRNALGMRGPFITPMRYTAICWKKRTIRLACNGMKRET